MLGSSSTAQGGRGETYYQNITHGGVGFNRDANFHGSQTIGERTCPEANLLPLSNLFLGGYYGNDWWVSSEIRYLRCSSNFNQLSSLFLYPEPNWSAFLLYFVSTVQSHGGISLAYFLRSHECGRSTNINTTFWYIAMVICAALSPLRVYIILPIAAGQWLITALQWHNNILVKCLEPISLAHSSCTRNGS